MSSLKHIEVKSAPVKQPIKVFLPQAIYKPPPIPKGLVKCLLIGINYENIPKARLYGCINDVTNIQELLKSSYPKCTQYMTITDKTPIMPTRANIILAINWLVSGLVAGQNIY